MTTDPKALDREITNLKYKLVNKLQEWKKREYSEIIINYLEKQDNISSLYQCNQTVITNNIINYLRYPNNTSCFLNFDYNDADLRDLLSFLISL